MTPIGLGDKKLDECFNAITADRDRITAFYDVRYIFAGYCEVVGSLGAAMIRNNIYPRDVVARLLADVLVDAITRESKTECKFVHGEDVVEGVKQ